MIDFGSLNLNVLNPNSPFLGVGLLTNDNYSRLYCGPDDDSCIYFADAESNTGGAAGNWGGINGVNVFCVDISGKYTWYSTGPLKAGQTASYGDIRTIQYFGSGLFMLTVYVIATAQTYTYWLQVQNLKLNNSSPIIFRSGSQISSPCAASSTLKNIYYDSTQKILMAGFYVAAGQYGTDIYSSAYNVTANGNLSLLKTGFIGNVQSGQTDPYDQVASYSGLTATNPQTNGLLAGLINWGGLFSLTRQSIKANPGIQTACNVTAGNPYSGASVSTYYTDAIPGVTVNHGENYSMCDTNINGLVALGTTYQPAYQYYANFVGGDNFLAMFSLYTTGIPGRATFLMTPAHFCLTKKYLFAVNNMSYPIPPGYICTIANPGIANGYNLAHHPVSLINNARPISTTGRYKA